MVAELKLAHKRDVRGGELKHILDCLCRQRTLNANKTSRVIKLKIYTQLLGLFNLLKMFDDFMFVGSVNDKLKLVFALKVSDDGVIDNPALLI